MKKSCHLFITVICLFFCPYAAPLMSAQSSLTMRQAKALDKLYASNYKKKDLVAAEFNLLECIELLKKKLGNKDSITLNTQLKLAGFYQETGQLDDADRMYRRLMEVVPSVYPETHPKFLELIYNGAVVHNDLGAYGSALDLYKYLKDICLEHLGKENQTYVYALEGLATTYYNLERYSEAESCYQEVLSIQKELLGTEHPKFAFTLSNLATVYQAKNKNIEAIRLIKQALSIQVKTLGPKNDQYANSLNTLAVLYTKLERYDLAESTIQKGLAILERRIGDEHAWYLSAQANLVALWIKQGAYKKAEKLCLELNQKQRKLLGKKHPSYVHTLGLTAKIYLRKGALDLALKYLMEALNGTFLDGQAAVEYSEVFIQKIPSISYNYQLRINNLYEILLAILEEYYKETKAIQWLEQRHQVIKQVILLNETFRNEFTFETDKYFILNTVATFINEGMKSCLQLYALKGTENYKEDAFLFAEENKSILLLDALKSREGHSFGNLPDSLVLKEKRLQKEKAALQKNLLETLSGAKVTVRSKLNELNDEISEFKATLRKEHPSYFQAKYGRSIITNTTKEIQEALDDKTVLLEYFVADSITYLFALTKKNIEVIPLKINKKALKEKVNAFHGILSQYDWILEDTLGAWRSYVQGASWFYHKIVAPAKIHLKKGIDQLIIVPDSELGHLPFEAFLVREPTETSPNYSRLEYLLNDYRISYNYSALLWRNNQERAHMTHNGKMLALASTYSDLGKDLLLKKRGHRKMKIRMGLKALPAVMEEVVGIASIYGGKTLTNELANESLFKQNAPNYDIIHLAMHGVLNQETPLLSSLVFTENMDTLEDNFLHAYEISQLKLNAQLVVLSACETGVGKFEQGEGVLSLARSFMYAGVPSLVVSLWQVHDFSTALLMQAFYANLKRGMDKAEALRDAKKGYVKHAVGITGHPAFWSAFIQVGDSRAIQTNSRTRWVVGALVVGILLFVLFFLKNRQKEK